MIVSSLHFQHKNKPAPEIGPERKLKLQPAVKKNSRKSKLCSVIDENDEERKFERMELITYGQIGI